MGNSRGLSSEEEAELARSNKKVKDSHHANFMEDNANAVGGTPWMADTGIAQASFKDKLVGEIPGAYRQAFDFTDEMEEIPEVERDISSLREGLAAVRLSNDLKQKIRAQWTKALIIKVYGRSMGFSFLQEKIMSLWKLRGRIDCVDLGNEFFLVRFSVKEDYNLVLEKGPWFIGEHFLSIRPWVPNFRPSASAVSSIAVWVRLNELPIEYYQVEALKEIGSTIGTVLRINTHTALESRGRYARICVQIDVEKPLITVLLIGNFEQPVIYEGIHRLCFSCGRIGHRKEACPYIIRPAQPPCREETDEGDKAQSSPCEKRAADSATE
ncbi:hypothetical protein SO802_000522 [Lithocarpus litseifolius]|uniref:CCHC-type domain-containing protein n=1 Tax=Lithocarpus litseifolius TaxID=425828 RepID=A0AAW2DV92_9ROSI